MILSVHATFGAAVASLVPSHPVTGFALGFLSHFFLDTIPHKDYELISIEPDSKGKMNTLDLICRKFQLIRDMLLVSFDALVGFCLAFMFFYNPDHPWVFLVGAVASMLPDFFTFLYLLFKHKPLVTFFDFHSSVIHSKLVLKLNQVTGVVVQFFTVALLIAILFILKQLFINYN